MRWGVGAQACGCVSEITHSSSGWSPESVLIIDLDDDFILGE